MKTTSIKTHVRYLFFILTFIGGCFAWSGTMAQSPCDGSSKMPYMAEWCMQHQMMSGQATQDENVQFETNISHVPSGMQQTE